MASNEELSAGKDNDGSLSQETTPTAEAADIPPPAKAAKKKNGIFSIPKKIWTKSGLDPMTLLIMAKGGLPPAISLAIYQATPVAETFTTIGYLIGIMSIIGFAIMPRAKFLQTMTLNVISICIASAVAILEIYCAVKARQHTTKHSTPGPNGSPTPGAQTAQYNSSASAVSAIWFFFQIYLVNTVRAKYPQFIFPTLLYSIFTVVASTYAPQFPTMAAGLAFARRLLITFLTGFGITTGVSLLIVPTSSRTVVLKEMNGYIMAIRKALKAQGKYLESLEDAEKFSSAITRYETQKDGTKPRSAEAKAVKGAVAGIQALHGKLIGDLTFAKREVALGKLGPDDLQEISRLLRNIMLPIIGLSSVIDIFERLAESNGWTQSYVEGDLDQDEIDRRKQTTEEWTDIMKHVHDPFESTLQAFDEGLEHILLQLQFSKPSKPAKAKKEDTQPDVEGKGEGTGPGEKNFAVYFEAKNEAFWNSRQLSLRDWCQSKGIELAPDFFRNPETARFIVNQAAENEAYSRHQRKQRQLYMLLFMEFLLYSIGKAILAFIKFADSRVESGKMKKNRLIVPGAKRMRKWIMSLFKNEDGQHGEDNHIMADVGTTNNTVYLGEAFTRRKDPEHLPPENALQRMGEAIRAVPGFFRSSHSAFGFRAACASMSIAIVCFLADTQAWFVQHRLIWAIIMVAISMNPTAGSSLFSFVLRVGGTVVAMILAYLAWYIPGQHTAGSIVFVWLFVSMGLYIPLKMPQFTIVGMISIVTLTLIVGYELEVRKVGVAVATSNGQEYYSIDILAPYRLATVAGGLLVAFIWTIFPFPISEHSQLRQSLGGSLYLLANFYSIAHETIQARIRGDEGALEDKNSPGHKLEKARNSVFAKSLMTLNGLRTYSAFTKWEVPIGGRFPKKQYDAIISSVESILNFMALASFASGTYTLAYGSNTTESETQWISDFRKLMSSVNPTSHEITSLLSLLSASIQNGTPLPPYLRAPKPYQISAKLEALDQDILSVRHVAEPGYAAFAVLQISTRCIIGDLETLLRNVRQLVGELDFSFHVVSTNSSLNNSSETLLTTGTGAQREKHD